jgi:hypothetical protein
MSGAKSDKARRASDEDRDPPAVGDDRPVRIIAVDLPPAQTTIIRNRSGASVTRIRFDDLDLALLARMTPDTVLAPLVSNRFDILDLADRLKRLEFGGQLGVVTGPLPDNAAVIDEIRRHCPEMKIALIVLAERE